jgi:hypothetical protein
MRIVYLMSNPAHCPYLVTSLKTLRNHYGGQVVVHAWPASMDICEQIAKDSRLDITVSPRFEETKVKKRRNAQFTDKISLMQCEARNGNGLVVMYLDADTIIAGSMDTLFDIGSQHEMVATQFNEWTTNGRVIQARLRRMLEFPEIDAGMVNSLLSEAHPSVNGGVFTVRSGSTEVLDLWYKWTLAANDIFICDEAVLHLMQKAFSSDQLRILLGGAYNCSARVKLRPKGLKESEIRVFHGHGNSFTRPKKCPIGSEMWWKHYLDAYDKNYGNINDWGRSCLGKHLKRMEVEKCYPQTLS